MLNSRRECCSAYLTGRLVGLCLLVYAVLVHPMAGWQRKVKGSCYTASVEMLISSFHLFSRP